MTPATAGALPRWRGCKQCRKPGPAAHHGPAPGAAHRCQQGRAQRRRRHPRVLQHERSNIVAPATAAAGARGRRASSGACVRCRAAPPAAASTGRARRRLLPLMLPLPLLLHGLLQALKLLPQHQHHAQHAATAAPTATGTQAMRGGAQVVRHLAHTLGGPGQAHLAGGAAAAAWRG